MSGPNCTIQYNETIAKYNVTIVCAKGWFQSQSSVTHSKVFDSIDECYHWALCTLVNGNLEVFRKIKTQDMSTEGTSTPGVLSDDIDTVNILSPISPLSHQPPTKRKRRGKGKGKYVVAYAGSSMIEGNGDSGDESE